MSKPAAYSIGLDYGTNSCRSLIVNLETGEAIASAVYGYPSGKMGILTSSEDPQLARQNPQDYVDGCEFIIKEALGMAAQQDRDFSPELVVGIGVDTTGSTIIPVNREGEPLAMLDEFKDDLNAQVWLWKDHTASAEAVEITELARKQRPDYLKKCGGSYSSEWWWSKILCILRTAPDVYAAAYSYVEHCDWLVAELCGDTDPHRLKRSICAAGHKALYHEGWGGLPDKEFLSQLDPALATLRDRLYDHADASDTLAGKLSKSWADRLGLSEDVAIAVGAFDCHMGAVGAGVKEGTLVKVLGTSTCDITVANDSVADVPGLCGQVDGSVIPGMVGLEAGQSAVGDIFLWLVEHLVPDAYGVSLDEKFTKLLEKITVMAPGESGLLALDWNNGNRSVLTDVDLTGLILGQTLHTEAHEVYRAYIEATAFGARKIIERMEEHGVSINEVITTGGLSLKNPVLMQIYADVLQKPLRVSAEEQTCAMGAALFGGVAAGVATLNELQQKVVSFDKTEYIPNRQNTEAYNTLYGLYEDLHGAFGEKAWSGSLSHVMKELISLRKQQRKAVQASMEGSLA